MWQQLAVGAALVCASSASIAQAHIVEFNTAISRSFLGQQKHLIDFAADLPRDQTPEVKLLAKNGSAFLPCAVSEAKESSGHLTVILALSTCLSDESLHHVDEWVQSLKTETLQTHLGDGYPRGIQFVTTMVPGACQELNEKNRVGQEANHLDEQSARIVLASSDMKRIQAFERYGRLLTSLPSNHTVEEKPIAVVSFVNDQRSYTEVEQYEQQHQISQTFNFQLCGDRGKSCSGKFQNCIVLEDDIDVFMYNPFVISRRFHCEHLPGGIPITYLHNHERQCYCACPVGFEEHVNPYGTRECKAQAPEVCECEWARHVFGYRHEVTTPLKTCSFGQLSKWIAVPFPTDNYVADGRVNALDDKANTMDGGPHVKLSTSRIQSPLVSWVASDASMNASSQASTLPNTYGELSATQTYDGVFQTISTDQSQHRLSTESFTWRNYQANRTQIIDALTVTQFGKYALELAATDYDQKAQCHGCAAIVDHFRPQASTQCPCGLKDNHTAFYLQHEADVAELTRRNLHMAVAKVHQVFDFQRKAINDGCSNDNRCDRTVHKVKGFLHDTYEEQAYEDGRQCFASTFILQDFLRLHQLKGNPLVQVHKYHNRISGAVHVVQEVRQDQYPVAPGICTRCCSYDVHLREKWVDYQCNKDYDVEYCEGDSKQQCEFKQCLSMNGDNLVTVQARIRPSCASQSQSVAQEVLQRANRKSRTDIHRLVPCRHLGHGKDLCHYRAKIVDLVETRAHLQLSVGNSPINASEIVHWRYRLDEDEDWQLLEHGREEVFMANTTKITLEAWTLCGMARTFSFYVHLHIKTTSICELFHDMWYQTTAQRFTKQEHLCVYPHSNFAELTFDFQRINGLQHIQQSIGSKGVSLTCKIDIQDRLSTNFLHMPEQTHLDIIERYAVELVEDPTTKAYTNFTVACEFQHFLKDQSSIVHTCAREFEARDCEGPTIDVPEGECQYNACANQRRPGPFEACGGQVIRSTRSQTILDTRMHECCQSCRSRTKCEPLLGLPVPEDDLWHCVPQVAHKKTYTGHSSVYAMHEYSHSYW